MRCRYCKKEANKREELERVSVLPGGKRVTVCNECGGYEHCPYCKKLWENLNDERGVRCFECR